MKGVVLAGGKGTRLRPFTHTTQKQLLPVANRPVLEYVIEDLETAGINEIALVLGGGFPEKVKQQFEARSDIDAELTYIFQGEALGLADAVNCTRDFVGDDPFVVYFGDTIVGDGITQQLVDQFDPAEHSAGIPFQKVSDPSRFGIGEFDGDDLVRIREKPSNPPSDLAYIGVVAFSPVIFHHIEQLVPSDRGELELTDAIDSLVQETTVHWDIYQGLWKDVGTPDDLLATNRIKLDQLQSNGETEPVHIGDGSVVEDGAHVVGPVILGDNVTVRDGATVGPYTSIADGCLVENATVKRSVVLTDSTISCEMNIEESIIGPNATIQNSEKNKFVVGADSVVSLDSQ